MRSINSKICISIGNLNFKQCLDILNNNQLAELRLDLLQLSDDEISLLLNTDCKTILTFRPGNSDLSKAKNTLLHAIRSGADFVDIEMEANDDYFIAISSEAKKKGCKIIVSYHNYTRTPDRADLENIIAKCKKLNDGFTKISTKINNSSDLSRLLSLYENNDKLIAIGMGERGKISRIAATELGSPFTYVSPDDGFKTAEGQLSLSEYLQIRNTLDGLNNG